MKSEDVFDLKFAIASLYLWLFFGELSSNISRDFQRLRQQHASVRHVTGWVAFFFLFTLIDDRYHASVRFTIGKAFLAYLAYIILKANTRTNWIATAGVVLLLVLDRMIAVQIATLEHQKQPVYKIQPLKNMRRVCTTAIVFVLFASGIHHGLKYYRV
jgi:hypothetical protein